MTDQSQVELYATLPVYELKAIRCACRIALNHATFDEVRGSFERLIDLTGLAIAYNELHAKPWLQDGP